MTLTTWPSGINTDFFNFSQAPEDNYIIQEYASGRKSVILKNTRFRKKITCSLSLKVKNNEYSSFWTWFTDVLGGLAGAFTCSALDSATGLNSGTYYRFTETPSNSNTTLTFRTLSLSLEEVY